MTIRVDKSGGKKVYKLYDNNGKLLEASSDYAKLSNKMKDKIDASRS